MVFWAFAVSVFALSIPFTGVFNNTTRSILAAIRQHFMYSFTVSPISPTLDRAYVLVAAPLLRAAR